MGKLYIDNDNGIPQIGCTECGKCDSLMGKSLDGIMERGCCHYFPEFNLAEIHRMLHLPGGREVLDDILTYPRTEINNYSIHSKGVFYEDEYEDYLAGGAMLETGAIKDHTIFFRTCPFVVPGSGCTFPVRFRTTVCNFFICSEITERPDKKQEIEQYIEERSRYSRWIHRESNELQRRYRFFGNLECRKSN
ncbi:MAG: hypothetical protein HGA22_05325 [Clostridiales bacterium]|nr:hypothetical protein [Clostridiales bacterium]